MKRSNPFSRSGFIPPAKKRAIFAQPVIVEAKPRRSKAARIAGVPSSKKEVKAVDFDNVIAASTDLDVIFINGVANGTENWNRIGRQLEAKSVELRFALVPRPTTNGVDVVRVALVWDRDPDATTPLYSDIFRTVNNAGASSSNNESFKNLDNKQRFTILRDKSFNMPGYTNTAGVLTNMQPMGPNDDGWHQHWFVDLTGLQSRFLGTTAAIGSISEGGLFLVVAGGYSNATAPWSVNYNTRYQFTDD